MLCIIFYRLILFVLIIFETASFLSAKELPNTIDYKLDIKIDYNTEKLYGKCEITVSNGTEQPIDSIPLLLYRLLSVKSVYDENEDPMVFTQKAVCVTGWEKLQVNFVEISLTESVLPGDRRTIKLSYEGFLLGYANEGWRYVKDHINRSFTLIRTDGFGYPVIGYPTDQDMMAVIKERYHYRVNITIPDNLVAVSGGELIDKVQTDGETTYSFISKKPSWRLDVAIADYKIIEQEKNKICFFESDSTGAVSIINALGNSIKFYSEWFGAINHYGGYTVIEVPEGYSSQADVASFNITADNFRKPEEMLTIYHEISHLWNVKALDTSPSRFESEGLARFLEFLLSERIDSNINAASDAAQKYLVYIRKTFKEKPEYQNIPLKDYGIHNLTQYSYTLGMVVFALFYDLAGQEKFNLIISSYYETYSEKGATLDDFINCCKRFAPFAADAFFNDWIYSTNAIKKVVAGQTYAGFLDYYRNN